MSVRVAYGNRSNLSQAIQDNKIPKNTLIISEGNELNDSEFLYLDINGRLQSISKQNRFLTVSEAELYAKNNSVDGLIISVNNGSDWVPYVVNNSKLTPIGNSTVITDIKRIDGGIFK